MGVLSRTSVYVQGSWGPTAAAQGPTYTTHQTVVVEHKGNDSIGAGEKAMQGIQRHAAVSFGRW